MIHKSSRIGLIARCDRSGLGFQTKELSKLLEPTKILLVDSTTFNGREQFYEWYDPDITTVSYGLIPDNLLREWLKDIDIILTCEVPYNSHLYKMCRKRGIKTILQPNAELNPHILDRRLDLPDVFILPSPWLEADTRAIGVPTYIIKPPIIEPREIKDIPKEKGTLKVLHFGGRRAAADRNGTEIVKQLTHIPEVYIDIHDQAANEVEDQRELYEQGHHVILIPRRYGGLCLPMLESLSYGLPVIMPNIDPNYHELPSEWLTRASRGRSIKTKHRIDTYDTDPNSIIEVLERFRDMNQEEYEAERAKAFELSKEHNEQLKLWQSTIDYIAKS